MKFDEIIVLKVLAIALDDRTADHRIKYLLKKLFGLDSLFLDQENFKLFKRIDRIVQELNLLV